MTREPYAATPAGVIWKRTLLPDSSQPAGDAAAYELQFPVAPTVQAAGARGVEQTWAGLANLEVPESAPFRVAPIFLKGGRTPHIQVPGGLLRQITDTEMTRWGPDLGVTLGSVGLGSKQVGSAALVERPGKPPVLLLSAVPFKAHGWGPLPEVLSDLPARDGADDAEVGVETIPLPTLMGQIGGLVRRHSGRERRSAPRRGALVFTTFITGLLLAAMVSVQQASWWGDRDPAPQPPVEGQEHPVACPSLEETADMARTLLEKRGVALAENQLVPLLQAEAWSLVLLDLVEVARRNQDHVVVEPPIYLVEVNSQRCGNGRVLALTTVAAVLDSGRALPAVLLELELQVSPPRILGVREGPTRG
ncbi:hypothetical protein [Actinomyces minihominis]|uniref:hypothetical protein n=1 Tax=Actinomyces minihominis TaxID=2002838 RepID=UPI000C08AD4A|nr:hypothetical protein [Actinomyces minihominis]